jgi:hypothetical protein
VDGRIVVTNDSQESSLPESETAGSQKSTGSSEKETGSEQQSDFGHSVSSPPASFLGARGKEMMSKITVPPSPLNRLPKNLLRKKRVPSTPLTMLALLARELLYFLSVPISLFFGIPHFGLLLY